MISLEKPINVSFIYIFTHRPILLHLLGHSYVLAPANIFQTSILWQTTIHNFSENVNNLMVLRNLWFDRCCFFLWDMRSSSSSSNPPSLLLLLLHHSFVLYCILLLLPFFIFLFLLYFF